ncbi:hypothetical protein GIB67_030619, partial [Kingdonia uniflora]
GEADDGFDFVDIHKQPTFDHPLLQNYSVQDGITKDWWLINRDLKNPIIHGYWPKSLFPSLTQGANYVGWGAAAQAAFSEFSPQMGNG